MIAPADVAEFLSDIMICKNPQQRIYEITGPRAYSSEDIAKVFEGILKRNVSLNQVLPEELEGTLLQIGFSKDGAKNFELMTRAVIDGRTKNETTNPVCLSTDFEGYLKGMYNSTI